MRCEFETGSFDRRWDLQNRWGATTGHRFDLVRALKLSFVSQVECVGNIEGTPCSELDSMLMPSAICMGWIVTMINGSLETMTRSPSIDLIRRSRVFLLSPRDFHRRGKKSGEKGRDQNQLPSGSPPVAAKETLPILRLPLMLSRRASKGSFSLPVKEGLVPADAEREAVTRRCPRGSHGQCRRMYRCFVLFLSPAGDACCYEAWCRLDDARESICPPQSIWGPLAMDIA
ncbi:MAG: hypothetical protein CM1200mP9_07630 [Gammaproteobacteria bacterium]|nr:MAG: hypothetical protein CM1200mP9_07630 [Gammaproteobacteria bacterium]